jgi:hypothetical protein
MKILLPILLLVLGLASSVSANETHLMLLKLSPSERNTLFTKLMKAGNHADCVVTETFLQGLEAKTDQALWNVRCANKEAFLITVDADAGGSTTILACSVLKFVAKVNCFEKLRD